MKKVNRNEFLKLGMMSVLAPLVSQAFAGRGDNILREFNGDSLLLQLVDANDKQVDELLKAIKPGMTTFSRRIGSDFSCLSASFCSKDSRYYHRQEIVSALHILTGLLEKNQTEDGTVNISNLGSPPDTAFLVELLCPGISLLKKDGTKEALGVAEAIKGPMLKAGESIATGGVHTANHRWVISAALSQLNELYPNKRYTARIEDWLDEGIFIDKDGHYPERSITYSNVENTAFITIALKMKKPELLEPVRRNLDMLQYYMEPDGKMVTTDSRRQDQYQIQEVYNFYFGYRYLAIRDKNSVFAGIARFIESLPGFDNAIISRGLFHCLDNPVLLQELPVAEKPSTQFEKLFTTTSLLRIRRNDTTVTLFGGADQPIQIASGRSNSPNFFSYRKGKAILKYMRLSSQFFSMGYFYSEGMSKKDNLYVLHKKLEVPYYQPMPKQLRKKDGAYAHSPSIDGRFWNLMDFENRPVSNLKTMDTTIIFTENNGAVELQFSVTGLKDVPVTIELCFDAAGKISGVTGPVADNYFLEQGMGEYRVGSDVIQFGPGTAAHKYLNNLEGERYSTHFGTLRTDGIHVYITGMTPFTHILKLG